VNLEKIREIRNRVMVSDAVYLLCDALLEEDEPICPLCQEVEHDHDCPNNKPSLHERMTEYSAGFGNGHRDGEKKERERWIARSKLLAWVEKESDWWKGWNAALSCIREDMGVSDE